MGKQFQWTCPLCTAPDNKIIRGSEGYLEIAVGDHILRVHEERAALRAVDAARLTCMSPDCAIGRRSHYNKTIGNPELTLSEFDKSWLQGMRIKAE